MSDRLPSLPALRMFEAAGRLLSFTRAAAELHVTQAAVSHQIRSLEEQLGQPLFRRSTRRLDLTPAGQRLLPAATAAFTTLERAVADLRRSRALLTITTTPFFGARWLAPRLGRFAAQHPDIEVSVRHTSAVLDLATEGIDVAIRTGRGSWPGLAAQRIAQPVLIPVASPDYVTSRRLAQRQDILHANLLHDEGRQEWADWLTMAGLDPAYAATGQIFDDEHVLFAAALSGQGIALVIRNLVEEELRRGTLVPLFDLTLGDGWGYYVVHLPEMAEVPKVAAFRRFVAREAAEEEKRAGPAGIR
ncbi:MAG TPA: transcriptional regulator GcvA [Dongiaceae bacterium]|nr:transcriptional regulator GcvA [Dongiaceae bacterium]